MRHGKKVPKLGRKTPHRRAMLANLVSSLFRYKRVKTTLQKAKAAKPLADKLISLAIEPTLADKRNIISTLRDELSAFTLINEVAPMFRNTPRKGGYTRILRLGRRLGDGAEMAIFEIVPSEEKSEEKPKKKRTATKKETKTATKEEQTEKKE
ncbi:50S ribosomal protein L17 [bacterium]|nr:50S ribosomal protein L17 [bacterium]